MLNLAKIIKELENKENINYDEIFLNTVLNDLDTIGLIVYCMQNKLSDVSETLDINLNELSQEYYSDSEVLNYFENYVQEDFEDELLNKYSKIALSESIKNTKFSFSVLDVKQEALISMFKFKNDYYNKLSNKYSKEELEYILKYFIKKDILVYQKKEMEKMSEKEYIRLLYIKINSELNQGDNLEDILSRLGISKNYFEELEKIFGSIDEIYSYEEILDETNRLKRKYELSMKINKLNYLEEKSLISYLGLEGDKPSKLDKDFKNFIKNILLKISYVYPVELLDDLEYSYTEGENL